MEFHGNKAIYLQISDLICENILLKKWEEGGRIPSVREMAISIEVNPNTVQRTYTYLQDKGIIFNKRGIGFFIAENAFELTMDLKKEDFIKNECPHFFREMDLLKISFDDLKKINHDLNKT